MTSPFTDITDPAILRAMVQDGVMCNDCCNKDRCYSDDEPCTHYYRLNCPTCNGSGHTPLSNPDLNALAACWCEGWIEVQYPGFNKRAWQEYDGSTHKSPPAYTTSPEAAMRLQEKYRLSLHPCVDSFDNVAWQAFSMEHTETIHSKIDGRKSKCQVLTECALVAALTAAIKEENS